MNLMNTAREHPVIAGMALFILLLGGYKFFSSDDGEWRQSNLANPNYNTSKGSNADDRQGELTEGLTPREGISAPNTTPTVSPTPLATTTETASKPLPTQLPNPANSTMQLPVHIGNTNQKMPTLTSGTPPPPTAKASTTNVPPTTPNVDGSGQRATASPTNEGNAIIESSAIGPDGKPTLKRVGERQAPSAGSEPTTTGNTTITNQRGEINQHFPAASRDRAPNRVRPDFVTGERQTTDRRDPSYRRAGTAIDPDVLEPMTTTGANTGRGRYPNEDSIAQWVSTNIGGSLKSYSVNPSQGFFNVKLNVGSSKFDPNRITDWRERWGKTFRVQATQVSYEYRDGSTVSITIWGMFKP